MVESPIQIDVYYQEMNRGEEYTRESPYAPDSGERIWRIPPSCPLPDEGEMPRSWELGTIKRYIVRTYTELINARDTAEGIARSGLVIDVPGYLITWKGAVFFSADDWSETSEATAVPTTQTRLIPPSCIREISWIDVQSEDGD